MEAWIVYKKEDAKRNRHFIDFFKASCKKRGVTLQLRYAEEFDEKQTELSSEKPLFIVMRATMPELSFYFESLGILVFNSAKFSELANDKEKTLVAAEKRGIKIPVTRYVTHETALREANLLGYPVIIKPRDGHGGQDVLCMEHEQELEKTLPSFCHERFLMQKPVSHLGRDLRVYVLGGKVIASMLRKREDDFRSNYCLGGSASLYSLSEAEEKTVQSVIQTFSFDFAGIDFLFDGENMVLSEIEDVVGTRMLYHFTDIDAVDLYVEYILRKISI